MRGSSGLFALIVSSGLVLLPACGARSELLDSSGARELSEEEPACITGGAWQAVAPMTMARNYLVLARAQGRRVVAVGGLDEGYLPTSTIEVYRPGADEWTMAAEMANPRAFHTATTLLDGRILIAGGYTGALDGSGAGIADVEIFDAETGTLQVGPPMPQGRYFHDAVRLPDGRVLIVGGFSLDTIVTNAVLFNPGDGDGGSWELVDAPDDLSAGYSTLAPHPEGAFAVGTQNIYLFDAATKDWTLLHSVTGTGIGFFNLARIGSVGERFALADSYGTVAVGDRDSIAWGSLWTFQEVAQVPMATLGLCDSAVALADKAYRISLTDASVLSEESLSVQGPSGAVLSDGSLMAAGGVDLSFTPTAKVSVYR